MKLKEIVEKYEFFIGKNSFKLKNIEHLKSIHNIDPEETPGYEMLSEEAKEAYRSFIVNFFNAWGLEARSKIVPCGIHSTIERIYYIHVEQHDYNIDLGSEYIAINNEGKELFTIYSDYKPRKLSYPNIILKYENILLRFDYERDDDREWVRVSDDGFMWH